ncbi:unnamed protein product [Leuciscus chuanchicus]
MFPNEQREHNDAHRRITQGLTLAVKGDLSGLSAVETVSPQLPGEAAPRARQHPQRTTSRKCDKCLLNLSDTSDIKQSAGVHLSPEKSASLSWQPMTGGHRIRPGTVCKAALTTSDDNTSAALQSK